MKSTFTHWANLEAARDDDSQLSKLSFMPLCSTFKKCYVAYEWEAKRHKWCAY